VAGIGVVNWWFTGEVRVLVAGPIGIILIWGLMTILTPKQGMVTRHDSADTGFSWFFLAWFLLYFGGFIWLRHLLRAECEWLQWFALLAFFAVALLLFVWKAKPMFRRRKQAQEARQIRAMTEWEHALATHHGDSCRETEHDGP
jgi:Ca2+/Na+ antiporter